MDNDEFSVLHSVRESEDIVSLEFLASLLAELKGNIQLIYVKERIKEIEEEPRRELARKQREERESIDPDALLSRTKSKLEELVPNLTVSTIMASGDPVEEVLSHLDGGKIDMLSLEAHGRGGFRENILGAHVNKLVQNSPVPTLVHKGQLKDCERVLIHVPNDEERCVKLVNYVSNLFRGSAKTITFLSILADKDEKFEGYISGEEDYLRESIENYDREEFGYLKIAQEILEERGLEAEARYRIGSTQEEILTEAKEGRYDLMAFSPKKENVLASMWSGDKSLKLMQEIDISFLKYPESV